MNYSRCITSSITYKLKKKKIFFFLVRSAYFSSKFCELLPELFLNFFPNCSVQFGSKMYKFEFGSVRRFSKMHTSTSDCFLLAPISRLSGFPKCVTDIVSSSADASCFKKQNFMSDKKRTTFFHCFFVLVLKRGEGGGALVMKQLFLALEKKTGKKYSFFFIEQIVISCVSFTASCPGKMRAMVKVRLVNFCQFRNFLRKGRKLFFASV
jgi:hypothetical protein